MSAYIVCCCLCVDPNKLAQKLLDWVCSNLNKTCVYATLNNVFIDRLHRVNPIKPKVFSEYFPKSGQDIRNKSMGWVWWC